MATENAVSEAIWSFKKSDAQGDQVPAWRQDRFTKWFRGGSATRLESVFGGLQCCPAADWCGHYQLTPKAVRRLPRGVSGRVSVVLVEVVASLHGRSKRLVSLASEPVSRFKNNLSQGVAAISYGPAQ